MRNGNNRFYDLHNNRAMRNDYTLKKSVKKWKASNIKPCNDNT